MYQNKKMKQNISLESLNQLFNKNIEMQQNYF